uniref:Uncharacterized protein n=1 Tax=Acrobeloides nanus TaxID=290746 RepID=A0A914CC13_9BILA
MCIQRFSYPIARSLILRVNLFGSILLRHNHNVQNYRSLVIESLKNKFDHLKIEDLPKLKISVRDPIFRGMPLDAQHKLVVDLLPEHIRNDVVVESSPLSEESTDCEVKRDVKKKVPLLPDCNIPATPQYLLDEAVFYLSKQSGMLSSGCIWLCGSLALKNFSISNGFDPKNHTSKNHVVDFLAKSFDEFRSDLQLSWSVLNDSYQNSYEGDRDLVLICEDLKYAELFCNTLFVIHHSKQFKREEFMKYLPKSMTKEENIYFDFDF